MKLKVNSDALENNCMRLSKIGEIYYPLKANSSIDIIEALTRMGVKHTLISSNKHTFGITRSIYENSTVINTLLDVGELIQLYRKGVRSFVFDNFSKMTEFINNIEYTYDLEITAKLSVNGIIYSPFNTGTTKTEVKQMLSYLEDCNIKHGCSIYINKSVRGIVGQEETRSLMGGIENIAFVSLGGLDNHNIDWIESFSEEIAKLGIEFRIESGEYLLGKAIDCEVNIIDMKSCGKKINVYIDISTYVELYDVAALGKKIKISDICGNIVYANGTIKNCSTTCHVHIFGKSSDSNDYIGKYITSDIYEVNIGDKILLKDVGAYFNRINHI